MQSRPFFFFFFLGNLKIYREGERGRERERERGREREDITWPRGDKKFLFEC